MSEKISKTQIVIAKLCSSQDYNNIYNSSGSSMTVKFKSDGDNTLKRFKASFKQGGFGVTFQSWYCYPM